MTNEWWKRIVGFPGYEVSNWGRIRSWRPIRNNAPTPNEPRTMKLGTDSRGYSLIVLRTSDGRSTELVHRLVLLAFIGPCPPNMEARHLDGVRDNCCLDNLEWSTHVDNCADKRRHGTSQTGERHGSRTKPWRTPKGEAHGMHKLSASQVSQIRNSSSKTREIASSFGIHPSTVLRIRSGRLWQKACVAQQTATEAAK